MNTVNIKGLILGSGRPKICVPIVGKTDSEIILQAEAVKAAPADIAEFRADWYENIYDTEKTNHLIGKIRAAIGSIPLLFTIRTANEGGNFPSDFSAYAEILKSISQNPDADAIDTEIYISDKNDVTALINSLRKTSVVIASNHDFYKTPDTGEIVKRLAYMKECGADVCKIAVMPHSADDVLSLLDATKTAAGSIAAPIITMSMGDIGKVSRICGEAFGSCLTFGCLSKASAPGQIDAAALASILDTLHIN